MSMNQNTQPIEYLHAASEIIRKHPHLQQRSLKLASHQGKLLLHGQVPSFFEKQMAQEALRQFDQLAVIENAIQVCWEN